MKYLLPIALLLFASCDGILEGIYDNPTDHVDEGLPYGFQTVAADGLSGTIFVDASSYLRWTYFDLEQIDSHVLDFGKETTAEELAAKEPEHWDFAVHRSVPKTNGGNVARTRYPSVAQLSRACHEAGGAEALVQRDGLTLKADEWTTETVSLDLSQMLSGVVLYQPSWVNMELNTWLDIDISVPPPIYTLSRRAYLLRTADGRYYGLYLSNFRNSQNLSGWLTIDFEKIDTP